jgi:hypothetical protein
VAPYNFVYLRKNEVCGMKAHYSGVYRSHNCGNVFWAYSSLVVYNSNALKKLKTIEVKN